MNEHEIWNEIGDIYFNTGAYDKAIRTYKKVIELNPDFCQSYKNLASIFVLQGRHAEAIPMFQKGIELMDKPIDKAYLWNQLGDAYQKLGDHVNASISYQKASELDPEDTTFQENLAEVVQASRNLASTSLTENSPQNLPSSLPEIAEVSAPEIESTGRNEPTLLETGDMDDAEKAPEGLSDLPGTTENSEDKEACWVFKDNKPAPEIEENTSDASQPSPMVLGSRILSDAEFEKDVSENPDSPEAIKTPEPAAAQGSDEISFQDVNAMHPLNLAEEPSPIDQPEATESTNPTAHGLLRLGILHWRKKEYERAIQFLKIAIEVAAKAQDHFQESLSYNAIALVDTDLGKIEDAIQAYQSAANLAPDRIFPWNDLGNLNCKLDRYDDARAAFQEAIEHNPKDSVSWNGLGDVYHRLGRNEDAIVAYQLGNVFEKQGVDEDALKEFENTIDSEQEKPPVWNEAGNIYYSAGAYEDAIASYRKAIELDPTNATFQAGLERAERALEETKQESHPAEPGTLIETKSELPPQPENSVAEETSSDFKEADVVQPDSTGAEQEQVTEVSPERSVSQPDAVTEPEPKAAYWMFNSVAPHGSPQKTTTHNPPAVVETVLSAVKSQPSFSGKKQYEQVFSGNQVVTDTDQNQANLFVQLTPHAVKPVREEESVNVTVAKDNLKSASAEVDTELPKKNPEPANWRAKDYALQFLASRNQATDQPSLDRKTLDNDIAAYRRVIELNPRNDRAWDALGNMYETIGLHAEAASAFEQAIALDPHREVYLYHLGIALAYQKQYDKAIQALERVVALNPDYMLAHCALAGCYRRFGKEAEAQEHIKIARPSMKDENEYNRACFESISGDADRAFGLLEIALEKQQIQPAMVRSDPDLDFIRHDPRFEILLHRNKTISQ
jgi:superkiller protein 3